jgi:hypothetical protein
MHRSPVVTAPESSGRPCVKLCRCGPAAKPLRRAPAVAHPASAAAVRRAGELLPVLAQHLFNGSTRTQAPQREEFPRPIRRWSNSRIHCRYQGLKR